MKPKTVKKRAKQFTTKTSRWSGTGGSPRHRQQGAQRIGAGRRPRCSGSSRKAARAAGGSGCRSVWSTQQAACALPGAQISPRPAERPRRGGPAAIRPQPQGRAAQRESGGQTVRTGHGCEQNRKTLPHKERKQTAHRGGGRGCSHIPDRRLHLGSTKNSPNSQRKELILKGKRT